MSIFSGLFANILLKRKPQNDDTNLIVWPKMYFYIMIACSAVLVLGYLFILLLMIFFPERIVDYDEYSILIFSIVCIPLIIGMIILTVYLAKFKVIVKEDSFIYKNLFKRTKTYYYDNIYSTFIGSSYHCYQNDKLIVKISSLQDNCDLLHKCIKAYQKKHKIVLKDVNNGVIKRTKLWIVLSICYLLLSAIFNILCAVYAWWWYWTLLCHLPNLWFILSCLTWKITIKDGVLTKRSLFKGNIQYNIEELTYDENDSCTLYKIYYRSKKIIAFVLEIEYNSDLIAYNIKFRT